MTALFDFYYKKGKNTPPLQDKAFILVTGNNRILFQGS